MSIVNTLAADLARFNDVIFDGNICDVRHYALLETSLTTSTTRRQRQVKVTEIMAVEDSSLFKRIQRRRTNTRARRRETQQVPWYRRWKKRLNCCRKVEREAEERFTEINHNKTDKPGVSNKSKGLIVHQRKKLKKLQIHLDQVMGTPVDEVVPSGNNSEVDVVASRDMTQTQPYKSDSIVQEMVDYPDSGTEMSETVGTGGQDGGDSAEIQVADELDKSDGEGNLDNGSNVNILATKKDISILDLVQNCSIAETQNRISERAVDDAKENDAADNTVNSETVTLDDKNASESSLDNKTDIVNGVKEFDAADTVSVNSEKINSEGKDIRVESDSESNQGDHIAAEKRVRRFQGDFEKEKNDSEFFGRNEVTGDMARDLGVNLQPQTKGNKSVQDIQRESKVETKSKVGKSVPDIPLTHPVPCEKNCLKDGRVASSETSKVDKSVVDVPSTPLIQTEGDNYRDTCLFNKEFDSRENAHGSKIICLEKLVSANHIDQEFTKSLSDTQEETITEARCNATSGVKQNKGVKSVTRIPCIKDWDVPFSQRTDISEDHPEWNIPSGSPTLGFYSSFGVQGSTLPFPKPQTVKQ